MSWDIYGNSLRNGHCEVHPHVHESYPCSVCMSEVQHRHDQEAHYNAAMSEQYEAHCRELSAQHDEEMLREELVEMRKWRAAAQRIGEALVKDGPHDYYSMSADDWLGWALQAIQSQKEMVR